MKFRKIYNFFGIFPKIRLKKLWAFLYSLLPIWKHFYEFFGRPFSCGLLYVFYIYLGTQKAPENRSLEIIHFEKSYYRSQIKVRPIFSVLDRRVMYLFRQNPPLRNASTPSEQIKVYLKSDSLFSCTVVLTHGVIRVVKFTRPLVVNSYLF